MTRCSGSSGGISLSVRSAIVSRRAFRSSCWSCRALRVSRIRTLPAAGTAAPQRVRLADHVGGGCDRPIGVHCERGGHEQLCPVGVQGTVRRADLGGSEARERRRTIGPNDQRLGVHLPVRDTVLVEAPESTPVAAEELVVDIVSGERTERASVRVDDEDRIALVGLPRRDGRHHRDAGPLGGQREERLVLDLLEPAGSDVLRASVPDRVPRGSDELAVRRIASEDLDEERVPSGRGGEGEGHASWLERGVAGRGGVDAELVEHVGHLVEREATAGRAEEEVHEGCRGEPDQEPRDDPDRQRGAERDRGHGADRDQPASDVTHRASQVGGRRHDHRGGDGDPRRRVDRRRRGVDEARETRRGVGAVRAADEDREPERDRHREHLVEEQPLPPRREQDQQQQEERPDDEQVVRHLPEPPGEVPQLGHEVGGRGVDRRRARRVQREDDATHDREPQQDAVGGTTRSGRVGRRREDPEPGESPRPLSHRRSVRPNGVDLLRYRVITRHARSRRLPALSDDPLLLRFARQAPPPERRALGA